MVFPTSSPDQEAAILLGVSIIIGSSDEGKRLRSRPPFAAIATKPPALWEFFLTCAALASGMPCIRCHEVSRTPNVLWPHFSELRSNWPNAVPVAISNFQTFMIRMAESNVDSRTAVGWWVAFQVKGAALSDEELAAIHPIGALIGDGLSSWKRVANESTPNKSAAANRWPFQCLAPLYENTSVAIHARSRQRWLSSVSLGPKCQRQTTHQPSKRKLIEWRLR